MMMRVVSSFKDVFILGNDLYYLIMRQISFNCLVRWKLINDI